MWWGAGEGSGRGLYGTDVQVPCFISRRHCDRRFTRRLVAWHSGRTLVFNWRTFPVLRSLDLQLTGDHLCGYSGPVGRLSDS